MGDVHDEMYTVTAFVASVGATQKLILFMLSIVLDPTQILATPMLAMHIFSALLLPLVSQRRSR